MGKGDDRELQTVSQESPSATNPGETDQPGHRGTGNKDRGQDSTATRLCHLNVFVRQFASVGDLSVIEVLQPVRKST